MNKEYISLSHEKFKIMYHIIFSTKYRKKFLKGEIANEIKESMLRASIGQKWSIEIQEIDINKPDHIHLLIKSSPTISPFEIISRLKQFSTYDLWKKENKFMNTIYWSGKHYLWTRGYFCSSIGDASINTVFNYINNQG